MNIALTVNWWALAIRGIAGIVFGIAAFAWTGITLIAVVALFAAYLLVGGAFALVAGIRGRSGWLTAQGLLGLIAGVVAFIWAPVAALSLVIIVASWAILTGIVELVAAVRLRKIVPNEWLLGLVGIASIIFGVLLAIRPAAGLVTIVWIMGAYALVSGVLTLALAFRLRGHRGEFTFRAFG